MDKHTFEANDITNKSCKSTWCHWKRIMIEIACAIVVGLVLGLGLGLGLPNSSKHEESKKQQGCFDEFQNIPGTTHHGKDWDESCPTPGLPSCPEGMEPPVLLISMDGFRPEYLTRDSTPTLHRIAECGIKADFLRAAYPTKTFPNHYSIVTGMYTEAHGLIDNSMFDQVWWEQFSMSHANKFDGRWYGGEPIWNTVTKSGARSACVFWPGSDADIQGMYPDICYNYDGDATYEDRILEVLGWFDLPPAEVPRFMSIYFSQPDSAGHDSAPHGDMLNGNLTEMDSYIRFLMDGLADRNMLDCVNIIILSDHGMTEAHCNNRVTLADYLQTSNYYIYDGPHGRITSNYTYSGGEYHPAEDPETPEEILEHLRCDDYDNTKDWYAKFWKKQDLPKRYHYANNRRIEEIVIDMENTWTSSRTGSSWYCGTSHYNGDHGTDNAIPALHAIFLASGPAFKQNEEVEGFDITEVYNLMAELLALEPAPNNGTAGSLSHLLLDPQPYASPDPQGLYATCDYPEAEEERDQRRQATDCSCNLQNMTSTPVEELDERLNLSEEETESSLEKHLLLGIPMLDREDLTVCQLVQEYYVSAFSHEFHMPLWTAFHLEQWGEHSTLVDGARSANDVPDCVRADVRLESTASPQCSDMNDGDISDELLYNPTLSGISADEQLDAHITSNIVPMYEGFRKGIWSQTLNLLEEYAEKYDAINVIMGPVFDYNYDGLMDTMEEIEKFVGDGPIPIPTHYFVTASHCMREVPDDCIFESEIMSFILPHKPDIENCRGRDPFEYLQYHAARILDVEKLTGLVFHERMSSRPGVWVAMRTELPVGLWERISWMDMGDDEQCPTITPSCPAPYNEEHPPLLLLSLDGYRWDYLDRGNSPVLERMTECGVKTPYLHSMYPSHTFPNHYSISTGLYPESHGIIDNTMYDMELGERFSLGSSASMNPDWWGGEPIWNTVEHNGKTSMTYFWPGSDVPIQGNYTTEYVPYSSAVPNSYRADTILDWLKSGSKGKYPDFLSLYFSTVDSIGHESGPDSPWVGDAMREIDGELKRLMDGIYRLGLHNCINIVIISDHGMTDLTCDRSFLLDQYLEAWKMDYIYYFYGGAGRLSNKYTYSGGEFIHLDPEEQVPVEEVLEDLECANTNSSWFHKANLPKRLHYAFNDRIDDIPSLMGEGWSLDVGSPYCPIKGQHGWDPRYENMQAFFTAYGPGFLQEVETPSFDNIELYNIMTYLIGVPGVPNNGTEGSLYDILREPPALPAVPGDREYTATCDYPEDDDTYNRRSDLVTSGCTCTLEDIREADDRLDHNTGEEIILENYHLPYGVPHYVDQTACLIHHQDFVTGYSHDLNIPLWVAYTLTKEQVADLSDPVDCLRPDVRMEQDQQPSCTSYDNENDYIAGFLFPPELSSADGAIPDAHILSNTVPMYAGFHQDVWTPLRELLRTWATQYEELHVVMGPVFDYNMDGKPDKTITRYADGLPIPSHYYAMVLRCDEREKCDNDMDYEVMSFVMPHLPVIPNCRNVGFYLDQNMVRIRDVELLTDLFFFTDQADYTQEAIQTRTFQPTQMWTAP